MRRGARRLRCLPAPVGPMLRRLSCRVSSPRSPFLRYTGPGRLRLLRRLSMPAAPVGGQSHLLLLLSTIVNCHRDSPTTRQNPSKSSRAECCQRCRRLPLWDKLDNPPVSDRHHDRTRGAVPAVLLVPLRSDLPSLTKKCRHPQRSTAGWMRAPAGCTRVHSLLRSTRRIHPRLCLAQLMRASLRLPRFRRHRMARRCWIRALHRARQPRRRASRGFTTSTTWRRESPPSG